MRLPMTLIRGGGEGRISMADWGSWVASGNVSGSEYRRCRRQRCVRAQDAPTSNQTPAAMTLSKGQIPLGPTITAFGRYS